MKTYQVEVEEILKKNVFVEANSEEEAHQKAQEMYSNEEIILGAEDFQEYNIFVVKEVDK